MALLFAAEPPYVEAARMFLIAVGNVWLGAGPSPSEPPGSLGGFYATNFRDWSWEVTAPQKGRDLVA